MRARYLLTLLSLSLIFLFPRLLHLEAILNFGSDQGSQLLEIYSLYKEKKVTFIGPPSSFSINGKNFFFGPATYYVSMPALILSNWNPLSVSYLLIFLQLASVLFLFHVLYKRLKNKTWAYLTALTLSFSPILVRHAQFYWNPNFQIPVSITLIALLLTIKKRETIKKLLCIGVLLGLGLQFHYSFVLGMIAVAIFLIAKKLITPRTVLFLLIGTAIGFSPIIIFELRHSFYNTQTFLSFFMPQAGGGNLPPMQTYYALTIIPLLLVGITYLLQRVYKSHKYVVSLCMIFYVAYSLFQILPYPTHGFSMEPGWNYAAEKKVVGILKNEQTKNITIVDVLTGDTRALAIRYLLEIQKINVLPVTDYPKAEVIFVYTRVPIKTILKGSLWELDVVKPLKVTKKWHLQNEIYLYRLEKDVSPK